jgi:hypothetical protein
MSILAREYNAEIGTIRGAHIHIGKGLAHMEENVEKELRLTEMSASAG